MSQQKNDNGNSSTVTKVKFLDPTGLELVPQPTMDKSDPLNWPMYMKMWCLTLASLAGFGSTFALATSNPAFVEIGAYYGKTPVQGGYPSTIGIAVAGIGTFLWIPLGNVWGRRPVLIFASLIATASTIGAGFCLNYGGLIVGRAIGAFGLSVGNAMGAGVVVDLFFLHQRGKAMGFFTVLLTNGAHVASLPGGYLAEYVGWRWTLYLPAIYWGILLLLFVFSFPETLYIRPDATQEQNEDTDHDMDISEKNVGHASIVADREDIRIQPTSSLADISKNFTIIPKRIGDRKLNFSSFWKPLTMFAHPVVPIVSLYYGIVFTFGSVLPALTCSKSFHQFYGFEAGRTGLCLSLSTTIGGVLGEIVAGPVIDRRLHKVRARSGGNWTPETRLHGMWPGAFLLPAGLLIFGLCIHNRTHYVALCIAMALTCFAVQIVTTPAYSYLADSYKPQSTECAQCHNFVRQTIAMGVAGFGAIEFQDNAGYDIAYIVYTVISVVFFIPVIYVIYRGASIREKSGEPTFNKGN